MTKEMQKTEEKMSLRGSNGKKKRILNLFFDTLVLLFGNALYAFTVQTVVVPNELVCGGVTGISVFMQKYLTANVSYIVFALNIALFILGTVCLGKHFFVTTLASTLLYPAFLNLFEHIFEGFNLVSSISDDLMLCVAVAGLGIGIAVGSVVRIGSSTGGSDIPPLVVNKYFGVPVGTGLLVLDASIICVQLIGGSLRRVLYGVIMVVIYSVVIDRVTMMGSGKVQISVMTEKTEEVRRAVLTEIGRGVTLLSATKGLSGEKGKMVMSVLYKRQLPRARKIIQMVDPSAFIVITRVAEVNGNGFSFYKGDKKLDKDDVE